MIEVRSHNEFKAFSKWQYLIIMVFLVLLTAYTGYEVYDELSDLGQGESALTVWMEILIVSSSLGFIYYITRLLYQNQARQHKMGETLKQVRQQLASSNERLRQGKNAFREVVEWQLQDWQFTPSEKEIALLLLKGLSVKEIADIRNVQEKTVRNQLSVVYEKSGLAGRHLFSAWFFEDLL